MLPILFLIRHSCNSLLSIFSTNAYYSVDGDSDGDGDGDGDSDGDGVAVPP